MHNCRRHRMNTLHWLLLAVVLLMLCVHPDTVQAQQPVDMQHWSHLIYKDQLPILLNSSGVWASSSQWFWTWEFQYNTLTRQTTQSPADHPPHPSQIKLSATTLTAFGIDTSDPDYPRAYYSVSPNGEYVAYSIVVNDGKEPLYDDPNCVTREIRVGHVTSLISKAIDLQVHTGVEYKWYGDSAGLLVSAIPPCGDDVLRRYVTSLSPNLTAISVTDLFPWNLSVNGTVIAVDKVSHTSRDGTQVLLLGVGYLMDNDADLTPIVVLLNTRNPANTRILFRGEQIPNNAFFKCGDETKLLIISADGFVEYDLDTKQTIMLDSTFNGSIMRSEADGGVGLSSSYYDENYYVSDSTISPNGRWLIYSHWTVDDLMTSNYVVDLAEALYGNSTVGNATPTDLPTYPTDVEFICRRHT